MLAEAGGLLRAELTSLRVAVRDLALRHRATPMVGRTHGMHAEPITFGLKGSCSGRGAGARRGAVWLARRRGRAWASSRARSARSRTWPAAGRGVGVRAPRTSRRARGHAGRAARPPRRAALRDRAGRRIPRADSRRRSATSSAPRCARRREPFGAGRRARRRCRTSGTRCGASGSAGSRGSCAATPSPALENVALWHERDISHSSVERVILPDAFLARRLHDAPRCGRSLADLVVYAGARCARTSTLTRGLVYSQRVLLALTARGCRRATTAYAHRAGRTRCERGARAPALSPLAGDPRSRAVLGRASGSRRVLRSAELPAQRERRRSLVLGASAAVHRERPVAPSQGARARQVGSALRSTAPRSPPDEARAHRATPRPARRRASRLVSSTSMWSEHCSYKSQPRAAEAACRPRRPR